MTDLVLQAVSALDDEAAGALRYGEALALLASSPDGDEAQFAQAITERGRDPLTPSQRSKRRRAYEFACLRHGKSLGEAARAPITTLYQLSVYEGRGMATAPLLERAIAGESLEAIREELGLEFGKPAAARAEPAVEVEPEDRERPSQSEENAA